jgi:hypothetical protein
MSYLITIKELNQMAVDHEDSMGEYLNLSLREDIFAALVTYAREQAARELVLSWLVDGWRFGRLEEAMLSGWYCDATNESGQVLEGKGATPTEAYLDLAAELQERFA